MRIMHLGCGSLPEMEVPHDEGHKQDIASLALGSDPMVGMGATAVVRWEMIRCDILTVRR